MCIVFEMVYFHIPYLDIMGVGVPSLAEPEQRAAVSSYNINVNVILYFTCSGCFRGNFWLAAEKNPGRVCILNLALENYYFILL